MTKPNPASFIAPDIFNIKPKPAVAHLRTPAPVERRNLVARAALLQRIRAEFEEMPGMSVTSAQAARLFGISPEAGARILEELVTAEVLDMSHGERYGLRACQ